MKLRLTGLRCAWCALIFEVLVVLPQWGSVVSAQERIYRCGNEYTNHPARAKQGNCQLLSGGHLTVVHPSPAVPATARNRVREANATAAGQTQVTPAQQHARDTQAYSVLQAELAKVQQRLSMLRLEYNQGNPHKTALELRNPQIFLQRLQALEAQIADHEADLQSLERELARHEAAHAHKK